MVQFLGFAEKINDMLDEYRNNDLKPVLFAGALNLKKFCSICNKNS